MALTISNLVRHNVGDARLHVGTIAFDDSYPTGGESLTAANVGLQKIDSIDFDATAGFVFQYDFTNSKVLVYQSATVTPTGTLSKPTFTVAASGAIGTGMEVGLSADAATATFEGGTGISAERILTTTSPVGTPTFTGGATTAAALAEVDAATDLSVLLASVRFRAWGR